MFMMACAMAMFIVLGNVTLPSNPSTSSASVGKDFLFNINTGTATVPVWTLVGGQRSSDLDRKADSIDISHKTSGGWKSAKAGLRSWSINLAGLVLLQDSGLQALEQAFMDGVEINVQLVYPDATSQTGWGSITDFSLSNDYKSEASIKGTIEGDGPLTYRIPSAITPTTATMSEASPADKVFNITPTSALLNTVKLGDVALALSTAYTYTSGVLTLKGTYLEALAVGTYVFNIDIQNSSDVTVSVTITA